MSVRHAAEWDHPVTAGGDGSAQRVFVPGNFDLWPWHLNSSERKSFQPFPRYLIHKQKTRAKDVLPNINCTQAAKITPGSDGMVPSTVAWRYICSGCIPFRRCRVWWECTARFFPGDLDLWSWHQTRRKEEPRTSCLWIWRTSVQRFQRYFIHKKKQKVTGSAKNRTLRSLLRVVIIVFMPWYFGVSAFV